MKNLEKVQSYFKWNKKSDVLYFTSECDAFFQEADAVNAAKGLADKRVIKVTRAEAEAMGQGAASGEPVVVGETPTPADAPAPVMADAAAEVPANEAAEVVKKAGSKKK